ncbi:hypothetical protein [Cystobacter fuscus]|uniref:hypothetical protein n=1 Tax=Cystobacter fuscus TaxID=43 RepID=UPI002B2F6F65|nr:hypothetical protein F0U63_43760 [Cystobacter fuscus]
MKKLNPRNLTAQLNHRATGNPASTLPDSAISNSFPGLEFDFRNLWRRMFEGLVMSENSNYVVAVEDERHANLLRHRMLRVDGLPLVTQVKGPQMPGGDPNPLGTAQNPSATAFMEWSNALMRLWSKQGEMVACDFTLEEAPGDTPIPSDGRMLTVELKLRKVFDTPAQGTSARGVALNPELLQPGELTQGLCSPWQNDYRECACYYWAASRPDYVNVRPDADGSSRGDNWMQKQRTGEYVPDNRQDSRLFSYDDLFKQWQRLLRFQIHGRDADESLPVSAQDKERVGSK